MNLPVSSRSPTATPADLVRLFHQSDLDWCRHLGAETTLDTGTLISNPDLSSVPQANCFADARLLPAMTPEQLIEDVQSRSPTAPCRRWTLNPSDTAEYTAPIAERLVELGWSKAVQEILLLRQQRSCDVSPADLTVIPGRASFGLYRRLLEQRSTTLNPETVEAEMLHLDDSHFEPILAIRNQEPVASIGVLISGEVGTLHHWFVRPADRRTGIGRFMLGGILDFCGRAGLRHVMIAVPPGIPATNLLHAAGFDKIGDWTTFTAPEHQ